MRAGVDGFAHQVRDKDVDQELLDLLKQRPHVFFMATLWSERRAMYTSRPRWLDEPGWRPHVLLIAPARPQHGGHGALYVLLRRSVR